MADKILYKVKIKKTDEGYSVWVPGLPGCWSQGKTEKESLENIKDAIKSYLETVEELNMAGIVKDAGLTINEFKKLL